MVWGLKNARAITIHFCFVEGMREVGDDVCGDVLIFQLSAIYLVRTPSWLFGWHISNVKGVQYSAEMIEAYMALWNQIRWWEKKYEDLSICLAHEMMI